MTKFTREEVTAAIEEAVAEKGNDYIYPNYDYGCSYADENGEPSCIVGHVVAKLDPEKFAAVVDLEDGPGGSWPVYRRSDYEFQKVVGFGDIFDDETIRALSAAQSRQDKGDTWGEALVGYYNTTD